LSEPTSDSSSEPKKPAVVSGTTGWAAFTHRDFQLFFVVRVLNGAMGVMLQLAIGWEVWRITRDEWALGMIGLVMFAPNFIFFLAAGTIADRLKRQYILGFSYACQAVCAILLIDALDEASPNMHLAYVILFTLGTLRAFSQPAQGSILPNVVPPEHFSNAVAWSSSAHQLSVVIGPVIAGALLVIGARETFIAITVGYAVAAILILFVRARSQQKTRGPVTLETLFAGIRYIYNRQIILGAMTLDLFAVLLGMANALLPVFATDILNIGEVGLGFLRGAQAAGAVLCGLALTRIPVKRHAGNILLVTVGIYGAALFVFGVSEWVWLSLLSLAIAGSADMVSIFIRQTLVQLATPDEMRGRVAAVHGMFTNASGQLGDFRAGAMAAMLGAASSIAIGAAGTVALAVLWAWWFPKLRRVDSLDIETLREDADRGR
jgi:predicted MFS family arabinose efflux permease